MSIKGKTFQAQLGNPLNTHNFLVRIADPAGLLSSIQMMVSSTTFPSERLQQYVLYFQGEPIRFPSIPTNSGSWKVTMPEGEFAKMQIALESHMKLSYDQKTGKLTHWSLRDKYDIEILARGLRGDVDGSDVLFGVKLIGCWMTGKDDVSLSNQAATTHWEWGVEFSFDSIENIEATPLGPPEV